MTLERRIEIERAIMKKLCDDAVAKGYAISLHDGEGFQVRNTRDADDILRAMGATDEETLLFYCADVYVGQVFLVYGNSGYDVICDHSDNEAINELLIGAYQLAETFENEE